MSDRSPSESPAPTTAQALRLRVAKARGRRARNGSLPPPPPPLGASLALGPALAPPPIETPASADATGPCAGVLSADQSASLDELVQLSVHLGPLSESNLYVGLSQDVGRGGVFVATHEHLDLMYELGRRVSITLSFPGGFETRALGLVRFARDELDAAMGSPPGLGIKFVALTPEGHELIRRFASHREPTFFTD